jgi:hypothetical protein
VPLSPCRQLGAQGAAGALLAAHGVKNDDATCVVVRV